MIRVAVLGAPGRMGSEVCRVVEADAELELVARVGRDDALDEIIRAGAEVAVDFTVPTAVKENVSFCLANGIDAVVGTSGLGTDDLTELEQQAKAGGGNVLVAPNFALGAVLMMTFAAEAARFYPSVEIVERHHERKLDAPSATALRTAALMNEARGESWAGDKTERETVAGSRGGDASGVRIHSLRLPGSVAHQEVVFGAPGETLTIRHDSLDRSSFMPGVLLAIKKIGSLPGLTVGLEKILLS